MRKISCADWSSDRESFMEISKHTLHVQVKNNTYYVLLRLINTKGLRIFVYREPIDMRCGFEKLHSFCVHQMKALMDQGHVYLFFGKNRRRLKLLVYDGSGLVLIAKRMER